MIVRMSTSEDETERIAAALAGRLAPGMVVALHGELGAGKTRFVRGLARGLGLDPEQVSSPTFVIEHRYDAPGAVPLVHIDAYRITGANDLDSIGWDELLADANAVVAVEWAGRIQPALPASHVAVRLAHRDADTREIEIEDVRPLVTDPFCAVCRAPLTAGASTRFCSDRCRMLDLGRWFRGDYAVGRPLEEDDFDGSAGSAGATP